MQRRLLFFLELVQERGFESLEQFSRGDLAIAGAIAIVGHYGQLKIERGLVRKEDMKKKQPSRHGERRGGIEGTAKGSEPKPVHPEKTYAHAAHAHRIYFIKRR